MVTNNKFGCHASRDEYNHESTQHDPIEHGSYLLQRESSWHLLFPEAIQYVNAIGDKLPMYQEEDDNYKNLAYQSSSPVVSIDATDAISPSLNSSGCHQKKSFSSSSSVSSSSDSSSEDLIFVGEQLFKQRNNNNHDNNDNKNKGSNNVAGECVHTELRDVKTINSCNFHEPEESVNNNDIVIYPTRLPSLSHGYQQHTAAEVSSSLRNKRLMSNPPLQAMHRDNNEDYDVKRISPIIFNRSDSLTPAEWSIASNESLFSLHAGNASIGRDQSILLSSGEFKKSTNLSKSSDVYVGDVKEVKEVPGSSSKSRELYYSSKRPPIPTNKLGGNSISFLPSIINDNAKNNEGVQLEKFKEENYLSKPLTTKATAEVSSMGKKEVPTQQRSNVHSSSISLRSYTSEDSNCSFAFLVSEEGEKSVAPKVQNYQTSHPSKIVVPKRKASRKSCCFSCFSCFSIGSFTSCISCCKCCSCPSFKSCTSCFSCISCPSLASCSSCFSCKSCCSCLSCTSCPSCTSCSSCSSCFSCTACSLCNPCSSCSYDGSCSSLISCKTCFSCSSCAYCSSKALTLKCC